MRKRLLIAITGDKALTFEIFARQHGQMLGFAHDAVASVRVLVHAPQPKGQPSRVGFEHAEPERWETLQDTGENEMAHGVHVVTRKTQSMVQSPQRELERIASITL